MTLKEAIEILKDLDTTLPQVSPERRREAVKLGIEAAKAYAQARRLGLPLRCELLPGETEE